MSRKEILATADFDGRNGVAGIAACFHGGRVISCDIVEAEDPLSADLLAVLRQAEITGQPRSGPALICTDHAAIPHCLRLEAEPATPQAEHLLHALGRCLARARGKIQIAVVPEATRSAYIAAKQTRKAWLAGREGRTETWGLAA